MKAKRPQAEPKPSTLPVCLKCGGRGYTGHTPVLDPDTGYERNIGSAIQHGTACDRCPAGFEFANWQLRWFAGDSHEEKNSTAQKSQTAKPN